jgi:hypothetical protein
MPRFYSEYFYMWGYAATSIVLLLVALVASAAIIRFRPPIGMWLLVAGTLLFTGSLFINDVGWLILAGGDNSIDGLKEPGRVKILDSLRHVEVGLTYFGALSIVLSLLFLGKEFIERRHRAEQIQDAEQAASSNR